MADSAEHQVAALGLVLRVAVDADLPTIHDCAESAYARYIGAMGRRPASMDEDYASIVASGNMHVAILNRQVIGYLSMFERDDRLFVKNVTIHPDWQKLGLAHALYLLAELTARRRGLRAIEGYTNAKMTDNLELYRGAGFEVSGRTMTDGFDRVILTRVLK